MKHTFFAIALVLALFTSGATLAADAGSAAGVSGGGFSGSTGPGGAGQPGTSSGNSADLSAAGTGGSWTEKLIREFQLDPINNPSTQKKVLDGIKNNYDQQDVKGMSGPQYADNANGPGAGKGAKGKDGGYDK